MKILITGYGQPSSLGETKPFRSVRLEVDLSEDGSVDQGSVKLGQSRTAKIVRSFLLKGRTRKVNAEATNNEVAVHIHDLPPDAAIRLAGELVKYAMQQPAASMSNGSKSFFKARSKLISNLFRWSWIQRTEYEDLATQWTVPRSEFLEIIDLIENNAISEREAMDICAENAKLTGSDFPESLEWVRRKADKRAKLMANIRGFYERLDDDENNELREV